jgi:hypothetical protein
VKLIKAVLMRLVATVAGAAYVTLCLRAGNRSPTGSASAAVLYLALVFAVLLLAVAAVAGLSELGSKISIPFFVVGTAIGVLRDALTDTKEDRNLFPIEVLIWCAMFAIAMGFGKELGAWWKKKTLKSSVQKEL